MVNIPLFTRFHTCWVVQDFFHQQYYVAHLIRISENPEVGPDYKLMADRMKLMLSQVERNDKRETHGMLVERQGVKSREKQT